MRILVFSFQFGGGRTIRPGELLETDEEKAAKEARSRELIAAYKRKFGLTIDPKLKSECEVVSLYRKKRRRSIINFYLSCLSSLTKTNTF